MADFQSKLIRKEAVANGTMAFYFEKPEGLTYVAGQHPTVRLVSPPETDEEGNERTFSFITIPANNEIGFATRMRDTAFKRTLKNATEGLPVQIINPRGSMVLPKDTARPLVFLAGGIGITPLISMVRQAAEEKSEQKIYLFYANRTKQDAAFFTELEELAKENSNFTFIPTLTQEDPAQWQGETGHIAGEMLKKYLPNLENTIYYLAGPTGMVQGMMDMLSQAGVDPIFIKSEDYGEYK
jgi:ferredoxin-NADP reductase